jgi:hypothetical protein
MCEFRANNDFMMFKHNANICCAWGSVQGRCIVVTYEIHVFFKGAQKQVFSSIFKFENVNT